MKYFLLFTLLGLSLTASAQLGTYTSGSATAKGLLNVVLVNQESLKSELPKGLELIPELVEADNTYPVVMFVGQHLDAVTHFGNRQIPLGKKYNEATFTINVQLTKNKSKRYSYTSRILVDNRPAQMAGWMIGYPKRLARINFDGRNFEAEFSKNQTAMELQITEVPHYDAVKFKNNLEALIADMPANVTNTPAGLLCFDFIWKFDQSKFRPVATTTVLSEEFVGAKLAGFYHSPSLDQTKLGSVYFEAGWDLKNF